MVSTLPRRGGENGVNSTPLEIMHYVYVLVSLKDRHFYIGYTEDLRRRIFQHGRGDGFSTKNKRPFKLIYYEACLSREDARAREKYLKSGMGHRYLKNRLENSLENF